MTYEGIFMMDKMCLYGIHLSVYLVIKLYESTDRKK